MISALKKLGRYAIMNKGREFPEIIIMWKCMVISHEKNKEADSNEKVCM